MEDKEECSAVQYLLDPGVEISVAAQLFLVPPEVEAPEATAPQLDLQVLAELGDPTRH